MNYTIGIIAWATTVVLAALKAQGVIHITWWAVFSPMLCLVLINVVLLVVFGIILWAASYEVNRRAKR